MFRAVKFIWQCMQQGNHSLPESIVPLTTTYPSLHRDYGVAVRGGISAFLTTNIACAFWILSGWKMGFMVAEMAAITACILTFLDDPVPALKIFIRSSIYAAIFGFYLCIWDFSAYHRILGVSRCISPLYYVLCDVVFTSAFACTGLTADYEYDYGVKSAKPLFDGSDHLF